MATLRHIATLPDACSSHDPKIEPDLIRTQPQKSAPAKMIGRMPHISGMTVNTSRWGMKKMSACPRFAQRRGCRRERLPAIKPRKRSSSGNPVWTTP
jgi:hypothetical protein